MRNFTRAFLLCLLSVLPSYSHCQQHQRVDAEPLICKVTLNEIEYKHHAAHENDVNQDTEFVCNPVVHQPDGTSSISVLTYELELSDGMIEVFRSRFDPRGDSDEEGDREAMFVAIPGGSVSLDSVIIPDGVHMELVEEEALPATLAGDDHHRKLRRPKLQGDLTVLVIRIVALDAEPISAAVLYESTFEADVSLEKQLYRCSFGKFRLSPTKYGVLDVPINVTASGNSRHAIVNAGHVAVLDHISEKTTDVRSVADFIMFVLPPGTSDEDGWGAYAATPGQQTVFNNEWGGYIAATAHELGHNLGLEHAFFGGQEYGGITGYMGAAVKKVGYPQRCYNGHNHHKLGWYSDSTVEVDPQTPGLYKVAGFVDYNKTQDDEYVVVKISSLDLFMQFNRAKDFNRDPGQFRNMLTIVKSNKHGTDLLGGLNLSYPLYRYQDPFGSRVLTVEVCDVLPGSDAQPDLMSVSIGYGDSLCPPKPPSGLSPNLRTGSPVAGASASVGSSNNARALSILDLLMITITCVCSVVFAVFVVLWCRCPHKTSSQEISSRVDWFRPL